MAREPIIDMHLHANAVQNMADGTPRPRMAIPGPAIHEPDLTPTTDQELILRTLEEMDKYNVVRAFLSSRTEELLKPWIEHAPYSFFTELIIDGTENGPTPEQMRDALSAVRHGTQV